MELSQQSLFDYSSLDSETRIVVQQRTTEIKGLMRRAAEAIVDIGLKLIEVKGRLGHGRFLPWLEMEFQWSYPSAARFMQVGERFGEQSSQIDNFAPSALYLLAAPSTPDTARAEAIAISAVEPVTYTKAKEIVERHRTTEAGTPIEKVEQQRASREAERLEELNENAEGAPDDDDRWRIVTGDCVEELHRLESPRLIFADPPYNIGIDYGDGESGDLLDYDEYVEWAGTWVEACASALAGDGSLWLLVSHEYAAEYALAIKKAGLGIRNWITWYEGFGVNCQTKFNRTSRIIFYAVKGVNDFVFNRDAVSRPSDRQTKYNDARANPDGKVLDDVWTDIPRLAGTHAERIPTFPTQLPIALLSRIIACASEPGDLVVDPFNGSGTTGAAALRLGRRYVGIEKREEFATIARQRLKGESNGQTEE